MDLGISPYGLPVERYLETAVEAEACGFESFWVPDHLVIPAEIGSRFPYSPSGDSGLTPDTPLLDAWVLLSFIAARTSTISFGPYVYILPLRHPFVTAKAAASLQILSGGRLLLGVGVGWLAEEYEAMGREFSRRGVETSEALILLRQLWQQQLVSSSGPSYPFETVGMAPPPPRIPIHVGGHSRLAVRRAAALADGWLGSPQPAGSLRDHLDEMLPIIETELRAASRTRDDFHVTGALLGRPSKAVLQMAAEARLDRLIVSPWGQLETPPSPGELRTHLQEIASVAAAFDGPNRRQSGN